MARFVFDKEQVMAASRIVFVRQSSANLLLPKIFKCELSVLTIRKDVNITFSDLKCLTNSGTIKRLSLFCKVYKCENNRIPIPVHRILALVPAAICIDIEPVIVEPKALKTFLKEERAVKFQRFELWDINRWFDPHLVYLFIKKNLTNNPSLVLNFKSEAMNQEFQDALDDRFYSILPEESLTMFLHCMEM